MSEAIASCVNNKLNNGININNIPFILRPLSLGTKGKLSQSRDIRVFSDAKEISDSEVIYFEISWLLSGAMANVTEDELSYEKIQRIACTASLHGQYFFFSLTVVNILLAITASLGNALILVALQRETSLHPPSKLMFQGLTVTDLCVGVVAQPLYIFSTRQQRIIDFNFVPRS